MSKQKENLVILLLIFIISVFLVFDLFVNVGRSANMDGLVHITTIAQFTDAFKSGDFPVVWLDGFANYGLPIGMFAQPASIYLGMLINLFVNDPVLAFNIVGFIAILLSNIFYYYFLRLYFKPLYAFLGTLLFCFAPFRIIDLYIRGAIPETFSTIFLPLTLISIYHLVQKKKLSAFFFLVLSLTGIVFTHPMTLVTYSFIFIPYFLFNLIQVFGFKITRQSLQYLGLFILAIILAVGLVGYYVIPLNLEIKYVYYGSQQSYLVDNQFMGFASYFDPNWYYFYKDDVFPRGHFIQSGLLETIGMLLGVGIVLFRLFTGKVKKQLTILDFAVITCLVIVFMTTQYSDILYQKIHILGNIQFPWRMSSALIFIPPIIITYIMQKLNKNFLVILLIALVCFLRYPQLYGKNYTLYPLNSYTFTPLNLHSNNMNTIWTGETEFYPIKKDKIEIIEGDGKILEKTVKNSSRHYVLDAKTELKVADYTFYFPGWHVYVDGAESPIQFQDPNYRGVITYAVPSGKHDVLVRFEDTKVRLLGKAVSAVFIVLLGVLFIFRKKGKRFLT